MKNRPKQSNREHPKSAHGPSQKIAHMRGHKKEDAHPKAYKAADAFIGIISVNSKGIGFIENPADKAGEDMEIAPESLHTALHKDEVEARSLGRKSKFNRNLAEVVRIIKRNKMRYVGVLEEAGKGFALIPDDKRLYKDIFVAKDKSAGGKAGDKVYVEIVEWDESVGYPVGKVLEVIGRHGEHNAEMRGIVLERGLAYDFPLKWFEKRKKSAKKKRK
jgi:ribonuclease R